MKVDAEGPQGPQQQQAPAAKAEAGARTGSTRYAKAAPYSPPRGNRDGSNGRIGAGQGHNGECRSV